MQQDMIITKRSGKWLNLFTVYTQHRRNQGLRQSGSIPRKIEHMFLKKGREGLIGTDIRKWSLSLFYSFLLRSA
jgi:hypothetical protein